MSASGPSGPLVCSLFFLSSKFFNHISTASIIARVLKFCIHAEGNQVYCCKQNQGGENDFALFFNFCLYISLQFDDYGSFRQRFLSNYMT